MPVSKTPITPKKSTELRSKIEATKPDQKGLNVIFAEVKAQLGLSGFATSERTEEDTREVRLTTAKCVVFLIKGAFEVGGDRVDGDGLGHSVENEDSLQLLQNTTVVIINTN
ncbi:hypothetical protein VE01_09462 [Pseudogymnoascus verrucosus]|uniref:Uncharacterized protein n=1 Tax=Pseudogymnoascus verrucosus TaxID=342668 RepID=A0A1B8G9L8_9PEZI|nr:uncharacterized protein VE01_09462 [Pseudogymnoascus verrucosus]OBT92534.2 hypothetical protein VE01_09462 [Pseudogymnoascus verrucosus]